MFITHLEACLVLQDQGWSWNLADYLVHPRTVMAVELPGLRRHTWKVINWKWWLKGEGPWLAVASELEYLRSWSSFLFITFVFCLPKPKLVRSAGSSSGERITCFLKFSS